MSVRKVLKSECGQCPEDAAAWLVAETGGQCVVSGKIIDDGDSWIIPVYSADGRNEWYSSAAAGRQIFRVMTPGVCSDGTRFRNPQTKQSEAIEFHCPKNLTPGTVFSATIPQSDCVDPDSIVVESVPTPDGLKAFGERPQFESVGPYSGGWAPITGNPNYSTGTPWKHPNDPRHKK